MSTWENILKKVEERLASRIEQFPRIQFRIYHLDKEIRLEYPHVNGHDDGREFDQSPTNALLDLREDELNDMGTLLAEVENDIPGITITLRTITCGCFFYKIERAQ